MSLTMLVKTDVVFMRHRAYGFYLDSVGQSRNPVDNLTDSLVFISAFTNNSMTYHHLDVGGSIIYSYFDYGVWDFFC